MTTDPNPRRIALHAIPFLACVVIAGASVAYAGRVPRQLASHWSGGVADGWMSVTTLTLVNGVLVLGLGFGLLKIATNLIQGAMVRPSAGLAGGLSVFLATLHVVTLDASVGVVDRAPVAFPGAGLLLAVLLAVGVGLVAAAVVGPGTETAAERIEPERLEVLPGDAVVWTGSATAPPVLLVLPAIIAVLGVVITVVDAPLAGGIVILSAFLATSIIRARVTVGPSGLTVRSGPFGVLRTHVGLADVVAVHAEHIEPMTYGGYGLRLVPGARAVVIRGGPGLRVERDGKADLVVTVDDAPRGAGVLLAHLAVGTGA
jgi:hypothetical protein